MWNAFVGATVENMTYEANKGILKIFPINITMNDTLEKLLLWTF